MKPSPEVEIIGLKAYEQVRAFEVMRHKVPLIYTAFFGISLLFNLTLAHFGHVALGAALLAGLFGFGIWTWVDWAKQKKVYAHNLVVLAKLEAEFGDDLPWIEVEKQMAQIDQIKDELSRDAKREDDGN